MQQVIIGVKEYSPLHLLPSFDVIKGIPVDYMHCVLIGMVKNMAKLWFNSTNHTKEYDMSAVYVYCSCKNSASYISMLEPCQILTVKDTTFQLNVHSFPRL